MTTWVCAAAAVSHDLIQLVRVNALVYQRGEILADFEIEVIRDVHRRVVREKGYVSTVTDQEWLVIDGALEAMLRAPRQDLTNMGLAA